MASTALLAGVVWTTAGVASAAAPTRDEIETTMKKATRFMADQVAYRGGYVWTVTEDLTRRYGEIPARPTQIWVQQATPAVGMTMLAAYEKTADPEYLEVARRAADALVFGQHHLGGWHYFVDFDPKGVHEWYTSGKTLFKWGLEEYRHFYGNCTFDDGVTAGATRFLLHLYLVTLDPAYRAPLLKALDFVLLAQYPNGAWPQRFPLRHDFVQDDFPDYTSYYTLNDGVAKRNIELLLEAHDRLGDERYLDAARRGMGFLIAVQGPEGQGAWAEQYDMDLRPVKARFHEPAGYVVRESIGVIELLERFYKMTGNPRYLTPIPPCLDWLERVQREAEEARRPLARYYEPGTNAPIYVVRTEEVDRRGFGLWEWTHDPSRLSWGGRRRRFDVPALRAEYQRLAGLSRDQLRAEPLDYGPRPDAGGWWSRRPSAEEAVRGLDSRGAWVQDVRVPEMAPEGTNPGTFELVRGISTFGFIRNMWTLMEELEPTHER
jgi:hypothetical protein